MRSRWRGRANAVLLCALAVLAPSPSAAQVLESFELLPLRVNIGDRIRIEDQSRVTTTGRVTRVTREEIALQTQTGERRFSRDDVREVAVRRDTLRRSALIGAGVLAVVSAVTVCAREDEGNCALVGLGAAPVGAGLGLVVGSLIPRMTTIYRAPPQAASETPPSPPRMGEASLLEDLALHVNLDDQLRIVDKAGTRASGRLIGLTAEELTLRTAAGERRFPRADLREVAVRRRPLRAGVLIGAGAGAALGALAACTGDDREECPDAALIAGGLGAGVGLGLAALMPRTTVVYPEAGSRISVLPVLTRTGVGVRVSRRW